MSTGGTTRVIKDDEPTKDESKKTPVPTKQEPATFTMSEVTAIASAMAKELAKELLPKPLPTNVTTTAPTIPMKGLYAIAPENYLDSPKTYYSFMALNALGPYRDLNGQVKMPPNGDIIVKMPFSYERKHGSAYIPVSEVQAIDKLMCEWIEGHPAFGITVHTADINEAKLSDAAILQQYGSRFIELYANMTEAELRTRALRLGQPTTDNTEVLKRNLAAFEAQQAFASQRDRDMNAQIDTLKNVAMAAAN